jgi:hypothetical protein
MVMGAALRRSRVGRVFVFLGVLWFATGGVFVWTGLLKVTVRAVMLVWNLWTGWRFYGG